MEPISSEEDAEPSLLVRLQLGAHTFRELAASFFTDAMSELIAEAALSKAALHKLGSEQLKQDLQLAAIAFVGLSCYHGPWRMIRFIFTELLWFCIGCAVWQRSFRCSGLEPVKKVDDNIRMAIFISSTIGALWWGCVASGFMLALMAHCIQNWWLAFAVNTALAVAVHKAGKIKCEQKKAWVALSAEDDPPLWLLDVCTIS
eukprot:11336-Heterococcus_DN1.PRE.1